MTRPLRSVATLTLALLAAGATGGGLVLGTSFGIGFLLSGLLLLASLALDAVLAHRSDSPAAWRLIPLVLKLPLVLGGGWLLLQHFPPLSVALGGAVLVVAITLHAALNAPARPAEGKV